MWGLAEGSWQAGRQQLQAVLHPAPSKCQGDDDVNAGVKMMMMMMMKE
jgi:hypothetical protein